MVEIPPIPSQKSKMIRDFFENFSQVEKKKTKPESVFRIEKAPHNQMHETGELVIPSWFRQPYY